MVFISIKQKRVAKEIIENENRIRPKTYKEMLESVSYGKISKQPSRIIQSAGVQAELKKYGFTEENAKKVLGTIIAEPVERGAITPDNQIRAVQETAKILGLYAPERKISVVKMIRDDDDE